MGHAAVKPLRDLFGVEDLRPGVQLRPYRRSNELTTIFGLETDGARQLAPALRGPGDHFDDAFSKIVLKSQAQHDEDRERQKSGGFSRKGEPCDDMECLQQRVREVQHDERSRTISEVLHLKVLHNFARQGVPLLPPLVAGGFSQELEPLDPKVLAFGFYSKDALELVRDHIVSIIGEWSHLVRDFPLRLSRLQVGQLYSLSALFGYALRRADIRFQLDRTTSRRAMTLTNYVAGFTPEDAAQVATIVSREAEEVFQRQIASLFGDLQDLQEEFRRSLPPSAFPEDGATSMDEEGGRYLREALSQGKISSVQLTISDIRRVAMEGCAFGTFLSSAEAEVEAMYDLTPGEQQHIPTAILGGQVDQGLKFSSFRLFGA